MYPITTYLGTWVLDDLWTWPDQLPEQVSPDLWLGQPFQQGQEHINSVAAMKLSPYFKVFEDDAMAWEDKLNRINALFDVWIDVQRRWVYLEGIFTGSADIKNLLPNESQRLIPKVC